MAAFSRIVNSALSFSLKYIHTNTLISHFPFLLLVRVTLIARRPRKAPWHEKKIVTREKSVNVEAIGALHKDIRIAGEGAPQQLIAAHLAKIRRLAMRSR